MELRGKRVLVCTCEGTMPLDGAGLAKACGAPGLALHHHLCRAQLDDFRRALGAQRPLLVACTQEAPLFEEARSEAGPQTDVRYANIRERAGWSDEAGDATPKIAALLAEATVGAKAVPSLTLGSGGKLLIYGRDERALDAARQLKGRLDVTVLLTAPGDVMPPRITEFPLFKGTIASATGHFGAFKITVDGYAPVVPSSRATLAFQAPRDGVSLAFDLILDLSGRAAFFSAADRDGCLRPDPNNPAAVQTALLDLTSMVGTFEKPLYVDFHGELCAHSRSRRTGCTRCLEVCPTSAITPAGDQVTIDPYICNGCGGCSSVCPTDAARYAVPPRDALLERLRILLTTYIAAGGQAPALLLHDASYGEEMIGAIARFGRGLPARVIPFAVNEVTQIGLEFLLVALAYGVSQILLLVDARRSEARRGLSDQLGLAEAIMEGFGFGRGRVVTIEDADPTAVERILWSLTGPAPAAPGRFLAAGGKRGIISLALRHLHDAAPTPVEILPLPQGAPFGGVRVDAEGCTLCLACVGACPTGALRDNPDKPELSFVEDACVQCGLCKNTCPEKVITLEPRLNLGEGARRAAILAEDEPFLCVRCGKPFASRASIEKVTGKLAGIHWMFQDAARIARIKMCEDCRVIDEFESAPSPMASRPRPRPRTTDDDLHEREAQAERARLRAEWEAQQSNAPPNRSGGSIKDSGKA
ncbi:MAG TPA: 4Fe-4S binding protein [Alphaproteobacteria bacterium]|nr:4Fe-4S binding protein [Alphaproteobacteria bacterium]